MDAARTEVDAKKPPGDTALQSAANDVSSAMVVSTALGSPTSNASGNLAVASAGLAILNLFFAGDGGRYEALKSLKNPALYLVSETDLSKLDWKQDGDKETRDAMWRGSSYLQTLPLGCDPARFHGKGYRGVIGALRGVAHEREFVCGFAEGEMLGFFDSKEQKPLSAIQIADQKRIVTLIQLDQLDKMKYMPKLLGFNPEDQSQVHRAGIFAFEKVKPLLGTEWTAIYTGPNASGTWAVFVSRDDVTMELPLPKK